MIISDISTLTLSILIIMVTLSLPSLALSWNYNHCWTYNQASQPFGSIYVHLHVKAQSMDTVWSHTYWFFWTAYMKYECHHCGVVGQHQFSAAQNQYLYLPQVYITSDIQTEQMKLLLFLRDFSFFRSALSPPPGADAYQTSLLPYPSILWFLGILVNH